LEETAGEGEDVEVGKDGLAVDDDVENASARGVLNVFVEFEVDGIGAVGDGEEVTGGGVQIAKVSGLVKDRRGSAEDGVRSGDGPAAGEVAVRGPDDAEGIGVGSGAAGIDADGGEDGSGGDGEGNRGRGSGGSRDGGAEGAEGG